MTDYLANLAARSLGRAPLIQPRLVSLFEPPRPTDRSAAVAAVRLETADNLKVPTEPHPAADSPAPLIVSRPLDLPRPEHALAATPDLSAVRAPGETASSLSAPRVVHPPALSPGPPAGPSKASSAETAADDEGAGRLERSRPDSLPRRSRSVPVLVRDEPRQPPRGSGEPAAIQRPLGLARHEPQRAPGGSGSEPAVMHSDAPVMPSDLVLSLFSPPASPSPPKPAAAWPAAEPLGAATLPPRIIALQAMPLLRPPATPGLERKAAPKASTEVHVTIGRVEVRATTTTPVRTQPPPAAAPGLSLEEYLRRRASGGPR